MTRAGRWASLCAAREEDRWATVRPQHLVRDSGTDGLNASGSDGNGAAACWRGRLRGAAAGVLAVHPLITLPSTQREESGEGQEVAALRKKKKVTLELQVPPKVSLPPTVNNSETCRGGPGGAEETAPSTEASSQPPACRESSLGRSHGLAAVLLAVGSGDSAGALSYPSPRDLSREALLGSRRAVLPDV